MKYFVLGALASGMLLYGLSMIYGATGSLDIDDVCAGDLRSGHGNQTAAGVRPGVRRRRARLQARRRAVPHVGARRLPRRADRGDAADRQRARSSRRSRSRCACWSRRCCGAGRRLAADADRAVRCCRWCSATSSRSRRPTSSACSPIRRSRTWASCCSAVLTWRQPAANGYSAAMFYIDHPTC